MPVTRARRTLGVMSIAGADPLETAFSLLFRCFSVICLNSQPLGTPKPEGCMPILAPIRHTKLLRVFRTISGTTLTALLLLRQGQSRRGSYRASSKMDAIVLQKLAYHLSACAGKRTISSVELSRVVDNVHKQVMRGESELVILLLNAHAFSRERSILRCQSYHIHSSCFQMSWPDIQTLNVASEKIIRVQIN